MSSSSPTQVLALNPSAQTNNNNINNQNDNDKRFDIIVSRFFSMYASRKIPESILNISPQDSKGLKLSEEVVVKYLLYKSDKNQIKTNKELLDKVIFVEDKLFRLWGRTIIAGAEKFSPFVKSLLTEVRKMKKEITLKMKEEEPFHICVHAIRETLKNLEKEVNENTDGIQQLKNEILRNSPLDLYDNQTNNTISPEQSSRLKKLNETLDLLNEKVAVYNKELKQYLSQLEEYQQNLDKKVEEICKMGESIKNDVDPPTTSSSSSSSEPLPSPTSSLSSSSSSNKPSSKSLSSISSKRPSPNPSKHEKED